MLSSQPFLNWVQDSSMLPNCHQAINWARFTFMGNFSANDQDITFVASFHIGSATATAATHLHQGHQQTGALTISYVQLSYRKWSLGVFNADVTNDRQACLTQLCRLKLHNSSSLWRNVKFIWTKLYLALHHRCMKAASHSRSNTSNEILQSHSNENSQNLFTMFFIHHW